MSKKMFAAEDIDGWNKIFVNGQIQESDLKTPTTAILVKALVAYLQKFGYDVEEIPDLIENTTSRETRLFLIKLAYNIDRMVKISDKSFAFYYYDLINPVPKKTAHTFGILLNYFYYYNVFEQDVFDMANDRINQYEELKNQIQAIQRDNQEKKQRADQIEEEKITLSKADPVLKSQLDIMKAKNTEQLEQLQKEQNTVEYLNKKFADLRSHERNLKKQLVENNEAIKIKSELNHLQTKINEQLSKKKHLEDALNERMETLKNIENLIKLLHEVKSCISPISDEYKDLAEKVKKLKTEYEQLSQKNISLLEVIEKKEEELENLKEQIRHRKQPVAQEKNKKYNSIKKLDLLLKRKNQDLSSLKSQLEDMEKQLEEHEETRTFLEIAINKILY